MMYTSTYVHLGTSGMFFQTLKHTLNDATNLEITISFCSGITSSYSYFRILLSKYIKTPEPIDLQ